MITAAQCLEARTLLNWTRNRLGSRCGISHSTIARFEATGVLPRSPHYAAAIQRALEEAGVEFSNHGQPDVRLQDEHKGLAKRGASVVAYTLSRLAPGSYDVLLNGKVIASLVRAGPRDGATWTAELLEDLPAGERPAPFTEPEHEFRSLEAARAWLRHPETRNGEGEL